MTTTHKVKKMPTVVPFWWYLSFDGFHSRCRSISRFWFPQFPAVSSTVSTLTGRRRACRELLIWLITIDGHAGSSSSGCHRLSLSSIVCDRCVNATAPSTASQLGRFSRNRWGSRSCSRFLSSWTQIGSTLSIQLPQAEWLFNPECLLEIFKTAVYRVPQNLDYSLGCPDQVHLKVLKMVLPSFCYYCLTEYVGVYMG